MRKAQFFTLALLLIATACGAPSGHPATVTIGPKPPPLIDVPDADVEDAPRILQVWMTSTTLHAGDTVRGRVMTPSNIASVELRVESLSMSMKRTDYGRFDAIIQVPRILPWIFRRHYSLQVIARTTAGKAERQTIPIDIR
jgi:hypothetical protein